MAKTPDPTPGTPAGVDAASQDGEEYDATIAAGADSPALAAAAVAPAPEVPEDTDDDKRRAEEHAAYHEARVAALDAQQADNNRRVHGITDGDDEPTDTTDAGE